MSTRRKVAPAVLAALVLAGCGSSGHPAKASPSFDPAFASRANVVCADEVTRHAAHPFPLPSFDPAHPTPQQLRAVAAYFTAYGDAQGFDRRLHALGQPRNEEAQWQHLLGLVDEDTARALAQERAGAAGDVTAWKQTLDPSKALYRQITATGRGLGFTSSTACGRYYDG